jgi:hypothetical protein
MTEKRDQGGVFTVTNQGTNNGAMTAGINNTVTNTTNVNPPSAAELSALAAAFGELRATVEKEADPAIRDRALERVEELQDAANPKAPDVSVMAAARNWFLKNAPHLAGAVTGVIIHPTVGRIVEAAGEALAREYREKFPDAPNVPAAGEAGA